RRGGRVGKQPWCDPGRTVRRPTAVLTRGGRSLARGRRCGGGRGSNRGVRLRLDGRGGACYSGCRKNDGRCRGSSSARSGPPGHGADRVPWSGMVAQTPGVRGIRSVVARIGRRLPHGWPDALRQLALWGLADALYEGVRGAVAGNTDLALANGEWLISLERATGTFWEPHLQSLVVSHHELI